MDAVNAQGSANQRCWLIELFAFWEGRVTTGHVSHFFAIGRQQASKELASYRARYPHQLAYSASAKGYVPTQGFKPTLLSGDVGEYLDWVTAQQRPSPVPKAAYHLEAGATALAPRRVSAQLIRPLVKALRQQQRLEVDYLGVTNPSREGRVIVPTRFVKTAQRWHLRAWCEQSQGYRDFVLSRFRGQPDLLGRPLAPLPEDTAWHTHITLCIKPDPRLSPAQQAALAADYGMENGELLLQSRAALANYLLLDMHIHTKMLDGNPAAQQLILANIDKIKPWLFGG
ncbi:WYL domain-containing protein [Gallaecimonas pentaromativorans]|uniref:WYL domain-containing protein n=1 Tax=Gallaecimonas pentaromativorans TaxID=584787 RepID=A0A3N1PAV5_9GAMM|nr:WYL domain-containing protein [Gallaecimonas pentaromativorans]ROQ25745.1 WYL domain-containing protein [Gallaecimonas pentaromativorans]